LPLSHPFITQEQYQAVLDAAVSGALLDKPTADSLGPANAEAAATAAAVDRPASSASGVSNGGGLGGGAGGVGGACVPAFKSACITALREYFDSSDVREVAAR
jgi:hypothetical protein